jgi:hypothetical protein
MPVATTQPQLQKAPEKTGKNPLPARHRPWWLATIEFAALAGLAVVGLETYFNLTGCGLEEFLQPDTAMGCRHIPGKRVVWRLEGFSDEKLSSVGLRDVEHTIAKPAGIVRVALLGDSATEALQVRLPRTYARLLEKQLREQGANVEVLNFGCSSYSTGQEYLQLKNEVAQYHPDITVVMYNRGDNIENVRDPRTLKADPRPYFYLDQSGTLREDDAVLQANHAALTPNAVQAFLSKNSRIYGVFSQTNLALSINEALYHKLKGAIGKLNPASRKLKQKVAPLYPPQDGWLVTSKLISAMNQSCKDKSTRFVVVCFPNVNNDTEYGRQIQALKEQSAREGFAFLDLTPTVRWNPDPLSLFIKYHFSNNGHQLTADQLTQLLRDQHLI